jgi:DNA invertase Pin-like site-specific DNA recombinase
MPESTKRAGLYARVSTEEQTEENQVRELLQLARAREWEPVIYRETASGAARERPELDRLLGDARAGRLGAVVVWALDRLSRQGAGPVLNMVGELDRCGVALVSVREPWLDTSGPFRDVIVAFAATMAQMERARIIERTTAGLQRVAREKRDRSGPPKKLDRNAKGWPIGRPPASPVLLHAASEHVDAGLSIRRAAAGAGVSEASLRRFRASKRPPRDSGAAP